MISLLINNELRNIKSIDIVDGGQVILWIEGIVEADNNSRLTIDEVEHVALFNAYSFGNNTTTLRVREL